MLKIERPSGRVPQCFLSAASAAALLASSTGADASPPPRLATLEVSVAGADTEEPGSGLRPNFDPETFHYSVRCGDPETLSVSGAAAGDASAVTLNGTPVPLAFEEREVVLRSDQALAVVVSDDGDSATYAVHCVGREFPPVRTVVREPGRRDGLLLVDPVHVDEGGAPVSHLAILDDNGVPRFHRRISGRVTNFRWHAAHRIYSYHREGRQGPGIGSGSVVLLDERFRPVARPEPVGLHHADHHDFLFTEEGNYLFVVYDPAVRDLSRYPDRNGEFPYSTAEPTLDSVIQEVSPEGEVLFQWNSWEREDGSPTIRRADYRWRYAQPKSLRAAPQDYAHLNSLRLVDGDIVASFRGCSQVLKIERPSGRVLWQLGGSRPAIPDGRVHYSIVGDPEPEGFCGQHTAIESPPGTITLFDNGWRCPAGYSRWRDSPDLAGRGARVVEYRLEGEEAVFSREYRSHLPSPARGAVQLLGGGRWWITWGVGVGRPLTGASEVDAAGREVFAIAFPRPRRARSRVRLYRAYREYGLRVPLNVP